METEQMKKKRIEQNKYKRTICKNAIWSLDQNAELVNTGCSELRQNGSSRCKKCSDKYKNTN